MPKLSIKANSTSQTTDVFIQDSAATDGSGKTGLVFNTSGLTAYYNFPGGSSTAITLATLAAANSAWSSGGFKEIDATNQKGHYRFDIPNTLLVSGNGRSVKIVFQGTGIVPCPLEIELTGWDNQASIDGNLDPTVSAGYLTSVVGRINQIYNLLIGKSAKDETAGTIKSFDPVTPTTVITNQTFTDDGVGNQTRAKTT